MRKDVNRLEEGGSHCLMAQHTGVKIKWQWSQADGTGCLVGSKWSADSCGPRLQSRSDRLATVCKTLSSYLWMQTVWISLHQRAQLFCTVFLFTEKWLLVGWILVILLYQNSFCKHRLQMLQTWFLSSKQPFQKQIDCTWHMAPNCQIEAGSCFGFAKPRYYYFSEKRCRGQRKSQGPESAWQRLNPTCWTACWNIREGIHFWT